MIRTKREVLALVLAGGKGERLHPLTLDRTKPSVPFGGKYRIIDFALSNLVNSGMYSIYILVQYKSQSLIEHIRTTWRRAGVLPRHFITVVPPQMRKEELKEWYRGTADSVYQNINLIYDFKPRFVAIFGGDHVYRMNIKEMLDFHVRQKADATVAVTPVHAGEAHQFGVVGIDENYRAVAFKEKPTTTEGDQTIFASMGNYIFSTDMLIRALEEDAARQSTHDFGRNILPTLIAQGKSVFAYDFSKNRIPSLKKHEAKFYWRDVGTISSYWEANMDLLGRAPKLDLNNEDWAIYGSSLQFPPAHVIDSRVENSYLSEGAKVCGAVVENSILGRGVQIEDGCHISESIIMDFTEIKKNSKIKKAIVDRFNVIEKGSSIGYDPADNENYYIDPSGIVVVKRGSRKAYYF